MQPSSGLSLSLNRQSKSEPTNNISSGKEENLKSPHKSSKLKSRSPRKSQTLPDHSSRTTLCQNESNNNSELLHITKSTPRDITAPPETHFKRLPPKIQATDPSLVLPDVLLRLSSARRISS